MPKGGNKTKTFMDLCNVFSDACSEMDGEENIVSELLDQLKTSSLNISGLSESDLTAIKVVNLLLPAVNTISTNVVGKHVQGQDRKLEKLCSMVRTNTYEIDRCNQTARRENIRIAGLEESEGKDDFEILSQMFTEMQVDVKKEDIAAYYRIGNPVKKPRPLLVRVKERHVKYKIFANKKNLKDKPLYRKVYINEDLTTTRFKLLQYVKKLDNVKSTSSRDGKIIGTFKSGKKFSIENPDDLFNLGVTELDYAALGLPEF